METRRTAEDLLNEKGAGLVAVPSETTIHDALRIMNEKRVGAILVEDGGTIVGIWTERDLMRNTLEPAFDPKTAKIKDWMTTRLVSCPVDTELDALADKILGLRLRHLLIERDGRYIGLLSSGDVIRAELQVRTERMQELDELVHLEYYEAWRWTKKRKK